MQEPILSLLFPLYRSRPYFNNLLHQIGQLSDKRYEIIISDRHCCDDTIDRLQNMFKNDSRFIFIKSDDCLDWTNHYNVLLGKARGKYFCWIPHDDNYGPSYFPKLIDALETQRNAIVAFATMQVQGKKWEIDYSIFKGTYHHPFTCNEYINLFNSGLLGIPFRGVFKRKIIIEKKLWIDQNKKLKGFQDLLWVFSVLLHGGLIYTEQTYCVKNFADGSAHSPWHIKMMSKRNPYVLQLLYTYIYTSELPIAAKLKLSINFLIPSYMRNFTNKRLS
jgi:GT2 family glycosyltransferase